VQESGVQTIDVQTGVVQMSGPGSLTGGGPAYGWVVKEDVAIGNAAIGNDATGNGAIGDVAIGDAVTGDAAIGGSASGIVQRRTVRQRIACERSVQDQRYEV